MKKYLKKLTLGALVAAVLLMAACAAKEKTITVPEFLKDMPLLIKTTAWCNENLGERMAFTQNYLQAPLYIQLVNYPLTFIPDQISFHVDVLNIHALVLSVCCHRHMY